jgi:hypothetical protein
MNFQYEMDRETKVIKNPTLELITKHLNEINPRFKSFFILTNDLGDFVQCAGAKLRLTIEFRHFNDLNVIGSDKPKKEEISINYSGGAITIQRNEVLTINDAIKIFETFYNTGNIPDDYLLRKVSETL